ncbi:MAG: hypothetical protein OHK0052_21090 [Anaerolineales bacterium]
MEKHSIDVLIVGAGISGLMAAQVLQAQGLQVLLIDKSRSVGGRMATRRIGDGIADHGAQFFSVRTAEFRAYVQQWVEQGLLKVWYYSWMQSSLPPRNLQGYERYIAPGGMNQVAKTLSNGLNVILNQQVKALRLGQATWQVECLSGSLYEANSVLLTAPVPQSLALLDTGWVALTPEDRATLDDITYLSCLCGLFWVEGDSQLPENGALQRPTHEFPWIADNLKKGLQTSGRILTLQANPEYSEKHWHLDDVAILNELEAAVSPFLVSGTRILETQLKRWRYAMPVTTYPEPFFQADITPPLVFAGDAFGGPRVEGAAISGLAAGEHLARLLKGA